MRKNNLIERLEQSAPPIPAAEAKRRSLLAAMVDGVTEGDVREIVAAQTDKAKGGDTKSAQFVLGMLRAGSEPVAASHHQQIGPNVIVSGMTEEMRSEMRRQIVYVLAAQGPMRTLPLVKTLHAKMEEVLVAIVDHDWFQQTVDGWDVTRKARAEVLGPLDQPMIEAKG